MLFLTIFKSNLHFCLPEMEEEKGQGLVEYALIILLVAMVVIGVLGLLGIQLGDSFSDIVSEFDALH